MVRRKQAYTSINPALFLTQALRTLEDAQKLENNSNQQDTTNAFQLYLTLVQTFQTVFGQPGAAGQERIRPLVDKHLVLQLVHAARDARDGFNRTHEALPIHVAVGIRSGYYPSPSYPCDVSMAVTWLEAKAVQIEQIRYIDPNQFPALQRKGKGKVIQLQTVNASTSKAPVLPAITVTASPPAPPPNDLVSLGECAVCASPFTQSASPSDAEVTLPKRAPTSQCTHSPDVCTSCLQQTIAGHLEAQGAARPVPCPHADCTASLSRDDVREWATEDTFARWDMLSLRELMRIDASTNPDAGLFVWCASPACYSGQLHPSGDAQPMVNCIRCGERTCFTHGTMWHEGQTCKQYDRSRPLKDLVNRGVSRAAIWWNTRKCPGCFQPISKQGGCRHMSCRCGYHFTWWYAPIHWRRIIPFMPGRDPRL